MTPRTPGTLALTEVAEPAPSSAELLVQGLAVGVCGTDKEIVAGDHGSAPAGHQQLVLGHESLGRVITAPSGSGFRAGDLVAGVVRRPDPVPCGACARGEFDMCRNGAYTERGIKGLDGFASERWVIDPDYAVRLDPALERNGVLMEPASVLAKAWEQVERIGGRSWFQPRTALVTGAGPIGLLAALMARQRGLDVAVLDVVTEGPKPDLVADLGADYHHEGLSRAVEETQPDIVIEATGVGQLVFGAIGATSHYGVVCLTGISPTGRPLQIDSGQLNRDIVLENDAIVGSVNANLRHYGLAAEALAQADRSWLSGLISRRVPVEDFARAFEPQDDDVKVVLTFGEG